LWGVTLYGAARYFIVDGPKHERYLAALAGPMPIDTARWHARHQPAPLAFSNVRVEALGNQRYDLFVEVQNPNDAWTIDELRYDFRWNDQAKVVEESTFILPGQKKYLIALGVESATTPTAVRLEVLKQRWHRVTNYQVTAAEKLALDISAPEFVPAEKITGRAAIAKTRFTVTNNSAYGFWQVGFFIGLYQGQRLAALNYVVQTGLESLERRTIEVNWYQPLANPTRIEVLPDVNILYPGVFKPMSISQ
ncbi:MAG: hypothetical protein AAB817_00260, partial [Patescibacteria group bacterium]